MIKLHYKQAIQSAFKDQGALSHNVLREEDIIALPPVVQKYIRFCGCVGKPKVYNFRATFKGAIRSNPDSPWMNFTSVQYNFIQKAERYFYIRAVKAGIPAKGLHVYKNAKARMDIKLLGVFPLVKADGPEMNEGETVTLINDMCIMAPATLIDPRISWGACDETSAELTFSVQENTVKVKLIFNEKGELINFISNNRSELQGDTFVQNTWSTPLRDYREISGLQLASTGEAVYDRPEGSYAYLKLKISQIHYNLSAPL